MNLITLNEISLVPNYNGNAIVQFSITIPKGAYIDKMYVVYKDNLSVLSDIISEDYDVVQGTIEEYQNVGTSKEWFEHYFTKVYEDDTNATYVFNNDDTLMNYIGNVFEDGIELNLDDNHNSIIYITLKLDTLTEAKHQASCSDSTITFVVYNKEQIMSDIVKYGRVLGDNCVSCSNIPDALIKKIIEYRTFKAAINNQDWLLVKELYDKIYKKEQGGNSISYTLTSKCNCNG